MDARSLLYVPATDEAVLRKAPSRGADALIVDLEDAVLPDRKADARATAARAWGELGPDALLRVNGTGSSWHADDLRVAREIRPAGVVLPKSEDPDAVGAAVRALDQVPVALMIETARGVLAAADLARVEGVVALLFGAADYRSSVRALRTEDESELEVPRQMLVLAARAAGIAVYDSPTFDYRDGAALARSAARARALGFDGKCAIHPGQLTAIHRAFTPTEDEVAHARAVVAALAEAEARGSALATVNGAMVEPLHAVDARRVLARAAK